MECHSCGEKLSGPVKFCPVCGTPPIVQGDDGEGQAWVADPSNPADKKATVAMLAATPGMLPDSDDAAATPASGGSSAWIIYLVVGLLVAGTAVGIILAVG